MALKTAKYGERISANLRRTLKYHKVKTSAIAQVLDLKIRAVQRRNSGDVEYSIDEIGKIIEFVGLDFPSWMEKALSADTIFGIKKPEENTK